MTNNDLQSIHITDTPNIKDQVTRTHNKSWIRKEPGSAYEKWNISVVI